MILLLDNYDSFTFNLQHYLQQLGWVVEVRQNDRINVQGVRDLDPKAIVFSPGPRRPSQAGNLMSLIEAFHQELPLLGICLGHQAIGEFFGASLVQGKEPVHGKTAQVHHTGDSIFANLPNPFPVMRYHSLVLEQLPDELIVIGQTADGVNMAIRHKEWPVWGLQFHPESIGTPGGLTLLKNWSQKVPQFQSLFNPITGNHLTR